jgi:hypothetical protein
MRKSAPAFVAAFFLLAGYQGLTAQAGGPAHAPDGRAPALISPLSFEPRPNAPFTATAKTLWVRILPDGSTVTSQNERHVARDVEGRIFQERVTFVPVPNDRNSQMRVHAVDYSDPVEHTFYHCDTRTKVCDLFDYYAPVTDAATPVGLQPDKTTYLTREDLGAGTFSGQDVQLSREITTLYAASVGNSKTILRTCE